MKRTVVDFLNYEISAMYNNIDRIEHGLRGRDLTDPALSGQCELLTIQREHLAFLEEVARTSQTYDQAIAICRDFILENEQTHRELMQREPVVNHSQEWWHSLHQIQFGTDVLHRIEQWHDNKVTDTEI